MRRIDPSMPHAVACRIASEEAGDLKARAILMGKARRAYDRGARDVACTLIHAEGYLSDRDSYARDPWPKNCIPVSWGYSRKEIE